MSTAAGPSAAGVTGAWPPRKGAQSKRTVLHPGRSSGTGGVLRPPLPGQESWTTELDGQKVPGKPALAGVAEAI